MNLKKSARLLLRSLAFIVLAVIATLFARTLSSEWLRVQEYEISANADWLISALLFSGAVLASALLWGQVVRAVAPNSGVKMLESVRAHLGSWIFRYIPGVGTVSYKLAWARSHRIRPQDAVAAFVYENVYLQVASLLGGSVVLIVVGVDLIETNFLAVGLTVTLLVGFGLIMSKRTIEPTIRFLASRRLNKHMVDINLISFWRGLWFSVEFLVPRVINALAVGVLATSILGPLSPKIWLVVGAAYAVAVAAGILAVFAPSGLGVREAIFVGILIVAELNPVDAITISIVARFVATLSDALIAGIFSVLTLTSKRGD
jgi:hypothetical protein